MLEVSSPGIDRPLTLPRHFRRNVGRLVDLRTPDGRQPALPDHRRDPGQPRRRPARGRGDLT